MPTCPGCHQQLTYHTVPVHLQFCDAVQGRSPNPSDIFEQFDSRLARIEQQVAVRLSALSADGDELPPPSIQ